MLDFEQIQSFYPEPYRVFKRNLLREYLQYKILEIIFNSECSDKLAFMGGTAIRIIHGSVRFSEDLDFDNFDLKREEFQYLSQLLKKQLQLEGYSCELREVYKTAFHIYISFRDLLYEASISGHKEEKLVIRVDTEPQLVEYEPEKHILNKFDVFTRINVVPAPIILSQKLLAILKRKRPMGRDFYDTIFLFGKTEPDFNYLKSKAGIMDLAELKKHLIAKCEKINFTELSKDIEPFLVNRNDANKILLFKDYVENLSW